MDPYSEFRGISLDDEVVDVDGARIGAVVRVEPGFIKVSIASGGRQPRMFDLVRGDFRPLEPGRIQVITWPEEARASQAPIVPTPTPPPKPSIPVPPVTQRVWPGAFVRGVMRGGERIADAMAAPEGGPPGGDPPADGAAARPRYLQGRVPLRVKLGDHVPLQLRIALAPGDLSAQLKDWVIPAGGIEVTLTVHAPGFVLHSEMMQSVHVPQDADSEWRLFELEATAAGINAVEVTAFLAGAFLGSLSFQIAVEEGIATGPGEEIAGPIDPRLPADGEVTLEVEYDIQANVYRFQFHGGSFGVTERITSGQMLKTPKDAVEGLIAFLNAAARDATGFTPAQTERLLIGQGIDLWNEFTSDEFKRLFLAHHQSITRLNIVSKGDPVPWELLYPTGGDSEGFLTEQFVISRQRYGYWPTPRLQRANPVIVFPDGSPDSARVEVEALQQRLGGAVVRTLDDLLARLDRGDFTVLHFACHNSFVPESVTASSVQMGPHRFSLAFMGQIIAGYQQRVQAGQAATPSLVFMNACRTDGVAPNYTQSTGWAGRFLDAGAGAFIGSLWEVRDGSARRFAETFYSAVGGNKNLGEAMKDARLSIKDEAGDPTWLAYTLHGDPTAVVT